MAKHKMAAAEMATDGIKSKECGRVFLHFSLFHIRPFLKVNIYLIVLQSSKFLEENSGQGSGRGLRLLGSSSPCHDHRVGIKIIHVALLYLCTSLSAANSIRSSLVLFYSLKVGNRRRLSVNCGGGGIVMRLGSSLCVRVLAGQQNGLRLWSDGKGGQTG